MPTINACCQEANETLLKTMNSAIEGLFLTDSGAEMIQRVHSNPEKNQLTMKGVSRAQILCFIGFAENGTLDKM